MSVKRNQECFGVQGHANPKQQQAWILSVTGELVDHVTSGQLLV